MCRFSKAIVKNYVVPSPRFHSERFISTLVEICEKEEIDFVIPTFEEIFCLSKGLDRFPKGCTVFCEDYQTLDHLHNKWSFNQKLIGLRIPAPRSYLVHSQEELDRLPLTVPYILKPSYSRAALKILKVTSETPPRIEIEPHNPLVAQEYIHGKKYCSYTIAHKGKLTAHAVYPLDISIEGNSCLNFEAIDHKGIESWVKNFVSKEAFTGQIAFDFIETEDKTLYAIECNPRGTSGIHLFQEKDDLPRAFFSESAPCKAPELGFSKQLAWGMLLYGWRSINFKTFIRKFFTIQDVVYSKKDLKPFFFQPCLFIVYLFRCLKLRTRIPAMFTFDIDWNGNEAAALDAIPCED